jgi:hypothetical protein
MLIGKDVTDCDDMDLLYMFVIASRNPEQWTNPPTMNRRGATMESASPSSATSLVGDVNIGQKSEPPGRRNQA